MKWAFGGPAQFGEEKKVEVIVVLEAPTTDGKESPFLTAT